MAYTPGFQNDIFVSYAKIDDVEYPPGERWVTTFTQNLEIAVRQQIGNHEVRVFFDARDIATGAAFYDELSDALRSSVLLVAILSPAYFASKWTQRELASFVADRGERNVLAVELRPSPDADQGVLANMMRLRFWSSDQIDAGSSAPLSTRSDPERYYEHIHRLAGVIAKRLADQLRASFDPVGPPGAAIAAPDVFSEAPPPAASPIVAKPSSPPVFVSCSSKDKKAGLDVVGQLEAAGIRCWISPRNIRPGKDFQSEIVGALKAAKAMLLIFSENANHSDDVKKELVLATKYSLFVIPVRIEDVQPSDAFEYQLANRQYVDLFADREASMSLIIENLRGMVEL